jgi:hypothetical protein
MIQLIYLVASVQVVNHPVYVALLQ